MDQSGWLAIKGALEDGGFGCQMCGAVPGDIDEMTQRTVRVIVGPVRVKSLGSIPGLPGRQALCSTCNQGAKNITAEKPTTIWLLAQIRRAGQEEQRAVYDWLSKKFVKDC